MTRIALSLLLVFACMSLDARETRLSGASGEGGSCPELDTATAATAADKPRATAPATRAKPAKPAATRGGTDGGRVQAPRWHSFLPGMFR